MTVLIPIVSFFTAVVVLVTAVVTYKTRRDVKEVHILVNSKMTAALERIEQLTAALMKSDTAVPEDPEERVRPTPPVIP